MRFKNQLYFNSINKKITRINLHAQTALYTENYRTPLRKIRCKYVEVYNVYGSEASILLTHNFFQINLLLQYSANHNPSQFCKEKQISSFLPWELIISASSCRIFELCLCTSVFSLFILCICWQDVSQSNELLLRFMPFCLTKGFIGMLYFWVAGETCMLWKT